MIEPIKYKDKDKDIIYADTDSVYVVPQYKLTLTEQGKKLLKEREALCLKRIKKQ